MTQEKINHKFMRACQTGNIEKIKHYLVVSDIKPDFKVVDALGEAVKNGQLEAIEYLVSDRDVSDFFNMLKYAYSNIIPLVQSACVGNHPEVVKYLVSRFNVTHNPILDLFLLEQKDHPGAVHLNKFLNRKQEYGIFQEKCKKGDIDWVKNFVRNYIVEEDFKENNFSENCTFGFNLAARHGHLELVQYLFRSPLKKYLFPKIRNGLLDASYNGHLDIVKYLIRHPEYKEKDNLSIDRSLNYACEQGHLDVVQYLLGSPDLKQHAKINHGISGTFESACKGGNLNIVRYLLTSPDIKKYGNTHPEIHSQDDYGFRLACSNGHLDLVQYLLTSPELLEHGYTYADPHSELDTGILWACQSNMSPSDRIKHLNVVQYLIFEAQIEKTAAICEYIECKSDEGHAQQLEKLFQQRDFYNNLHQNLSSKDKKLPSKKL